MRVYDPLYGRFDLPGCLGPLVQTPEVRRLSAIRLLNSLSPSIGALTETRRYSHSLGVVHLIDGAPLNGFSAAEKKALMASALLHDAGTPPFGHLLEYQLSARDGWSHESVLGALFWSRHAPENRAHQLFAGARGAARSALSKGGVDQALVDAILRKEHPLAMLLFGSLDFDNIDNVVRMAWGLGIHTDHQLAQRLAARLGVRRTSSRPHVPMHARSDVEEWASLRRRVYEILLFDPPTMSSQAILSQAMAIALDKGTLLAEDWPLTDESLLNALRAEPETRRLVNTQLLGRVPAMVFAIEVKRIGDRAWSQVLIQAARDAVAAAFSRSKSSSYLVRDSGTFEKSLEFEDDEGDPWGLGVASCSLIVYGFVAQGASEKHPSRVRCQRAVRTFVEAVGLEEEEIGRVLVEGTTWSDQSTQRVVPAFEDRLGLPRRV